MLSKEDKKIKIGVSILTFIIYEYKSWLSVETAGISKTDRVIVLQKMLQNTNCSFSVLFSVGHQGQDYFYLDKSIVSWIESLIDVTTLCV